MNSTLKLSFDRPALPKAGILVAFAGEGAALGPMAAQLDKAAHGHVTRAMKAAGFEGKKEQVLDLVAPGAGIDRLILMGLGKPEALTARELELLGGAIAGTLQAIKAKSATVAPLHDVTAVTSAASAAHLASGAALRCYGFTAYKTKGNGKSTTLSALSVMCPDAAAARKAFAPFAAIREGNHLARDLVNEPANVLFPVEFAARAKALAKAGLEVEVLTPAQMKKLGMHALLGVAQGSDHEARLVVMRWNGGKKTDAPLAFIGKGVTFDTGGVSIKPAAGMEDMKGDMAGAAAVTGLMLALARRKAKCNVVGAIGLVENAIDGKAQRPGDIVKSMSGQTIAVLNTDAEGRLVLADVLWYIQDRFKPKFMVNLATLTGAMMVALGKEFAGMFCNNDELAARLFASGAATGEKVWRMPLAPEYDKLIEHDVADMKNIGGRFGGAITAAQFLQRFVNNVPWAHLDVAGTAMDSTKTPLSQGWSSGWGVRLLNDLVARHYEG
ncbi:MAG: leucyl aminopeptidase [Rhizobiales bacterium]|nr:leucyl aminopeptidase [Hyphomicrobiales bacterium]